MWSKSMTKQNRDSGGNQDWVVFFEFGDQSDHYGAYSAGDQRFSPSQMANMTALAKAVTIDTNIVTCDRPPATHLDPLECPQ